MKHFTKVALAAFMALLMAVIAPVQIFAASKPLYISEIVMAYSKSDLEANGYSVVDIDVNAGNHGDRDVFIGYKTTDDPTEAITDIKMLAQGNGYSVVDSSELFGYFETEALEDSLELYEAVNVFRERYAAGDEPAKLAYTAFQLFTYDKSSGQKFGDFLLRDDFDAADLSDMILYTNMQMQMSLRQILAYAVYAGRQGDIWLGRYTSGQTCEKVTSDVKANAKYLLAAIKSYQSAFNEIWVDGVFEETTDAEKSTAQDNSIAMAAYMAAYNRGETTILELFTKKDLVASDLYDLASCMNEADIALMQCLGLESFFAASAEGMYDYESAEGGVMQAGLEKIANDPEIKLDIFDNSVKSENSRVAITNDMIREMTINDETGEFEMSASYYATVAVVGVALGVATVVATSFCNSLSKARVAAESVLSDARLANGKDFKDLFKWAADQVLTNNKMLWEGRAVLDTKLTGTAEKMLASIKSNQCVEVTALMGDFAKDIEYTTTQNIKLSELTKTMDAEKAAAFRNLSDVGKVRAIQGVETSTANATKAIKAAQNASKGLSASVVLDVIFVVVAVFIALVEINDYYHFMWGSDEYSERPESVFSLIYNSENKGKYVKYDAAYLLRADGALDGVADSNGYEGSEWNALYYTKSLTSGTPIRAESISDEAGFGRTPFSEFGKTNAFDLNRGAKDKVGGGRSEINLYFEHTDENTLTSIFSSPVGIALTAGIVLILGGGIFALISARKKKKAEAEQ